MNRGRCRYTNISIHAPREGGDRRCDSQKGLDLRISIHAPREGGDFEAEPNLSGSIISIHAPREGGDEDHPSDTNHV